MFKKVLAALVLVLVSVTVGCAQAPSQSYRPANYSGSPWIVTGDYNNLSQKVIIKINNQSVIDDKLTFFGGSGEFQGIYETKPVTVSCSTSTGFFGNKVNCMVFVSGDRAVTLTF